MKRRELEVALRAAARVSGERAFFLIGSQAVHGYCRRPPAEVLLSQECDLYPFGDPRTADVLNSNLGRGSKFARERGFYVDVVTPEIATLPNGWQRRLKQLKLGKITAHCLEIHDLILTKLAAGRLKDLEFAGALLKRRLANIALLRRRIAQLPSEHERPLVRERLAIVLQNLAPVGKRRRHR